MSGTSTPETGSDTTEPAEFEPITSEEELSRRIGARLKRERQKFADYDDLKSKAAKLDEIEAATKTETQKAAERIRELETQLASEKQAGMRATVAMAKGVPAKRLYGDTVEELEASADEYLAEIEQAAAKTAPAKPKPVGLRSGATGSDSRMDPKERAAAALRAYRTGGR